jgi:hypothetical protein
LLAVGKLVFNMEMGETGHYCKVFLDKEIERITFWRRNSLDY